MAQQPNNDNTNINNDDDEEEEVVTLSVTPSKAVVDVDFNNNTGDEGGGGGGGSVGGGIKAARLPRWTRQEILVLIQGKRVAENRVRRGRSAVSCDSSQGQQQQVEPKWATVSSYCKRHGVNRGPVQCRKRWSNLAGDFKKIKEWESLVKDEADSFWLMRNDLRREKKLPGFFDKEVFDILNNNNNTATATCSGSESLPPDSIVEPLFDSGRSAAADDGLFSDFEPTHPQQQQQQDDEIMGDNDNQVEVEIKVEPQPLLLSSPNTTTTTIPAPTPISEKRYQPKTAEVTPPGSAGRNNEKQQDRINVEIGSTSREGRKRKRFMDKDDNNNNGEQDELCQVLEKNGRILSAQLDAYNINLKLDREERRDHANSLVAVLNKLADSLGRIADKLS
ncbi:trihelix transcription factor ASR3-like [Chenopodium quinoa]|uniref:trihelix transcription factor ASR3-like n=1 Tax=Chenopodium quinoa TaxID=63459 RepID=UPI000B78895F|nr:trihelix transcription factor ASR3-like [Chenopodium quinoa]